MPWAVAQRVLSECEVRRSQGWEKTIEQLSNDTVDYLQQGDKLKEALKEHILCGEKASTFFHVPSNEMEEARGVITRLQAPVNEFQKAYPLSLTDEQLSSQPLGGQLAAIEKREDGVGLVFCSPRTMTSREPLLAADFPDNGVHLFNRFDEIVGMKIRRFHAFDIVWVPNEGNLIDVRIDYPTGAHLDQVLAALKDIINKLKDVFGKHILVSDVNLFPLIDSMYFDPKEGHVVELGFGTTTASLKHEKMRRGGLCLRKEAYHKGGSDALGTPIEPHRISIVWRRPISDKAFSTPELSLNSNSFAAGSDDPTLKTVLIQKCMGEDDYQFVRQRIEYHLETKRSEN